MTPTAQLRLISEVQKQPWVRVKDLKASLELVNICVHEATACKTFKKGSVPVMGHQEITCCCLMKRSLTLHSSIGEMWSDETKNYQERTCMCHICIKRGTAYCHENIVPLEETPQSNPVYCIRAWTACTHSGDGWICESVKNILYDSSTMSVHQQKVCKIWVMQQNKHQSQSVREWIIWGGTYMTVYSWHPP